MYSGPLGKGHNNIIDFSTKDTTAEFILSPVYENNVCSSYVSEMICIVHYMYNL